jgi:uncharacterized protein with von Willebrand factor type A (vWA) domain
MTSTRSDVMFVGVDRANFAAAFAAQLRRSKIPVAFTATERFARSLGAVEAPDTRDLYWMARLSFLHDHRHLERFDAVFAASFDTEVGRLPGEQRGQQQPPIQPDSDDVLAPVRRTSDQDSEAITSLPWATLPSATFDTEDESGDDEADDTTMPELQPSADAEELDRPFDLLDDAELTRVGDLLEASLLRWPQRRSRRRSVSSSGGHIAMRRTLHRAMRTGGDVVQFVNTTPRSVPRRIVAVVDVSGSMETYARAYLHLARPLALRRDAEVFAFSTDLTRITTAVRLRSPAEAIDGLGESVGDRFSGTRLAFSLGKLLRHRTWNTLIRGATVVIFSDGWDGDEPEEMSRQMRRLALRAHRVVWVNPRAASEGFEPLAAGMAAALPYCDAFLAGNTARSLDRVVAALCDTDITRPVSTFADLLVE